MIFFQKQKNHKDYTQFGEQLYGKIFDCNGDMSISIEFMPEIKSALFRHAIACLLDMKSVRRNQA